MQLGDILPYIDENENVFIWLDDEMISKYDGKDSIPVKNNALFLCEKGIWKDSKGIHIKVRE